MADIIRLKVRSPERICSNCEHAFLGTTGVYCSYFREEYWTERMAEDCEEFDPVENNAKIIRGNFGKDIQ